jgi:hypothetical protein
MIGRELYLFISDQIFLNSTSTLARTGY